MNQERSRWRTSMYSENEIRDVDATIERLRREYSNCLTEARDLGARLALTWLVREQIAWRQLAIWFHRQESQRVIELPSSMLVELNALRAAHAWLDEDRCMDSLCGGFLGMVGEILLGVVCGEEADG